MASSSARAGKVVVIGGGFTGTLFALRLAEAAPDRTIFLVESRTHAGRGLAYGTRGLRHLLNVPVARMEVGLQPGFADWLKERAGLLREALDESKGVLGNAFVPRQLFGDYMEQRLSDAIGAGNVRRVHGEAVRVQDHPRQVVLADGGVLPADRVVLAMGNPPPRLPFAVGASPRIVNDPWRPGVLDHIQPHDSLLLLGTGLTMVDTVLALRDRGHTGPLHAVSRHGLLSRPHRPGGDWPPFLDAKASPRQALSALRAQVRHAEAQGIPWQRVFDAARPAAASLWHGWRLGQRAQFLRHLRALWDVHRHRMADRIAAEVDALLWNGVLTVTAGHVMSVEEREEGLTAAIRPRGERTLTVEVDAILNCTGPAMDFRHSHNPLLRSLLEQGLVRSDPLGLGLDTEDCAAIDGHGVRSEWLFALGPLTRPAWWEITAVPEIRAQVERLVRRLDRQPAEGFRPLAAVFLDIGAGI